MNINFNFLFGNVNLHYELDMYKRAWFIVDQITSPLGYSRNRDALKMVNDQDKILLLLSDPVVKELDLDFTSALSSLCNYQGQRRRNFYIISDSGVYSLVLNTRANRPEIEQFKIWLVSEALPSIRMYSMYIDPETRKALQNNPNLIQEYKERIKVLEELIKSSKTYTNLGESVDDDSSTLKSLQELALKIYRLSSR